MTSVVLVVGCAAGLSSVLAVALDAHCEIHTAPSAFAAIRRLGEIAPDVLIVDIGAEPADGRIVVQATRARRPGCRIIMTQASADHGSRELAGFPVDRVLSRPVRVADVLAAVRAALSLPPDWLAGPARVSRRVGSALAYVADHVHEAITVSAIARAAHVSPSHLAHAFREATGMSVKAYVTRVRVDAARRALATGTETLDSIATACGFCDASHLSRTFRRYTGQRPTDYRRAPGRPAS